MSLRDGLTTHSTVKQRYLDLVAAGTISDDAAQRAVAVELDRLIDELSTKRLANKANALGWLFGRRAMGGEPVRGLYIHGAVGRGKTMLMDMFHELCPARRKRRAHFHDFMADVHERIHAHRQKLKQGETRQHDPIPPVADALADEAWVLSFDEFAVTDIADAMILSRLFEALFSRGVLLVATSNLPPDDLYRDGLNRQLFLPFVSLLKRHVDVVNLDTDVDYRMRKLDRLPVYVTPLGPEATRRMDEAWSMAVNGDEEAADTLEVKGHEVAVPRAVDGIARFSFADLCAMPLGASDYLALARRYHTMFVDDVPVLDYARRNEAKRFIIMIDTFYDNRIHLLLSAAAAPADLYAAHRGTEAFEFERTASRLVEMQSRGYLEASRAANKGNETGPTGASANTGDIQP